MTDRNPFDNVTVGEWITVPPEAVGLPPADPNAPTGRYRVTSVADGVVTVESVEDDA